MTTIAHLQLRHYCCRCRRYPSHSLGMSWLESLGLGSILQKCQESLFQLLQLGLDLRRRELILHPNLSRNRRSVPSLPRSKTYEQNWMAQLLKTIQIWELLSPAALQMAFTNALQATQSGARNNSGNNPQTHKPFPGCVPGIPACSWEGWQH